MSNQAAWVAAQGTRINVDVAPYPTLEPGQVIIKNAAIAINPVDWKMQEAGYFVKSWPVILGCDVAGEVVEVGDGVTNIKKGQRVLGHALSLVTAKNQDAGFQLYSSIPAVLVAPIPDNMSFEDASVIPLSLSTAAAGLYEKSLLALPYPSTSPKPRGSSILIWGGSSSVGSSAIQLAVASGLRVVSTASKRNFEYVKSLGAETVIDHSSPTVVDDLVTALKGSIFVGAYDSIGLPESVRPVAEVVSKLGGGVIADVLDPPSDLPAGVEGKRLFGPSIKDNEISKVVYEDYLPQALKDGSFRPMPKATVIGKGLDKLQDGFDRLKAGVSATKLVPISVTSLDSVRLEGLTTPLKSKGSLTWLWPKINPSLPSPSPTLITGLASSSSGFDKDHPAIVDISKLTTAKILDKRASPSRVEYKVRVRAAMVVCRLGGKNAGGTSSHKKLWERTYTRGASPEIEGGKAKSFTNLNRIANSAGLSPSAVQFARDKQPEQEVN